MEPEPRVALVFACDRRGAIGRGGRLPWRLPTDLARFRRITLGKPVVMGRRTFESIGRPLEGRTNVIVSRTWREPPPGTLLARSLEEALARARAALLGGALAAEEPEICVIGGAAVFAAALPRATRAYVTRVEAVIEDADTFFPPPPPGEEALRLVPDPGPAWKAVREEPPVRGERDAFAHGFAVLERAEAPERAGTP